MGRTCFAPNCRTGYKCKKNENSALLPKKTLFSPPKDEELFAAWKAAIPRSDMDLKPTSLICESHFLPEDIVSHFEPPSKSLTPIEMGRKKLKFGAIPSQWPDCPTHLSKPLVKRKQPAIRQPPAKKSKTCLDLINPDSGNLCLEVTTHQEVSRTMDETSNADLVVDINEKFTILLPEGWFEYSIESTDDGNRQVFYEITKTARLPVLTKCIEVDKNLKKVSLFVMGELVLGQDNQLPFEQASDISTIVDSFHKQELCVGIKNEKYLNVRGCTSGKLLNGTWYLNECRRLCSDGKQYCPKCKNLEYAIQRSMRRQAHQDLRSDPSLQGRSPRKYRKISAFKHLRQEELVSRIVHQKKKLLNQERAMERDRQRIRNLQEAAKIARKEMANVKEATIQEYLQSLSKEARMTVTTIVTQAKKCSEGKKKGMRYDAHWLLECLLLRIKSSQVYNHLRENKILPLPHPTTLGKMLNSMACQFGFNKTALEAIERTLLKASPEQRMGVLSFDEIKIADDISFNTQTFCFDGFVDLGQSASGEGDVCDSDNSASTIAAPTSPVNPVAACPNPSNSGVNGACSVQTSHPANLDACSVSAISVISAAPTSPVSACSNPDNSDAHGAVPTSPTNTVACPLPVNAEKSRKQPAKSKRKNPKPRKPRGHRAPRRPRSTVQTVAENVPVPVALPAVSVPPGVLASPIIESKLADHGVVFMFRSLLGNWVQPIGVFASRGAAPGEDLFRLAIAATIRLEEHGARVVAMTCDGAQNNKTVWKKGGISISPATKGNKSEVISNKMSHPTVTEEDIYFILDPPHAFKCVRNQIFNNEVVQVAGRMISHGQIQTLYDVDGRVSLGGKRICWRLRNAHIHPTPMQKMNVKLAVQVLSESVANGFRYFRMYRDVTIASQFKNTEEIEDLFRLLNKVFDLMNSRCTRNGLRPNKFEAAKEKFRELDEILVETEKLDRERVIGPRYPPPFISLVTLKAMRITMKSMIEITETLFSKGFKYILTGKLNQDCLERFFGIIRCSGGGNEMPTTSTFLQLFRMITLYYPTKKILRGSNVDSEEEHLTLLTSYRDWLKDGYKENRKKKAALKNFVKDILLNGIQIELETSTSAIEDQSTISDNIVYYISGYLVSKYKKKSKCVSCIKSVDAGLESLPREFTAADLTSLKSRGNLRFSSLNLHKLLIIVERHILSRISTGQIFNQTSFTDILTSVCDEKLPQVGCNEHKEQFMTNVIIDFMCSRLKCVAKRATIEISEEKRSKSKTLRKTGML